MRRAGRCGWVSCYRTPRGTWLSHHEFCRRSPISAPTTMAGRWKIGCVFHSNSSTRFGKYFRLTSRLCEGLGDRLGARGMGLEQTIAFAQELKKRGVDWIDASSADSRRYKKMLSGQLPGAVRTGDQGGHRRQHDRHRLITEAQQAEDILTVAKLTSSRSRVECSTTPVACMPRPNWEEPWRRRRSIGVAAE